MLLVLLAVASLWGTACALTPAPLDPESQTAAVLAATSVLERYGEIDRALELLEAATRAHMVILSSDSLSWIKTRLYVRAGFYRRADSILSCREDTLRGEGLALCRLARARLQHAIGRDEAGIALLQEVEGSIPPRFAWYAYLLETDMLNALGRFEEASALASRPPEGEPVLPLALRSDRARLRALLGAEEKEEALRFIAGLRMELGGEHLPPFLLEETRTALELALVERALETAAYMAESDPGATESLHAIRSVITSVPIDSLGFSRMLSFARVFIEQGDIGDARALIEKAGKLAGGPRESEELRLIEAGLLYREKRYRSALRLLETPFSGAQRVREALLLKARILRAMKSFERAAQAYQAFSRKYPSLFISADALLVASDLYQEAGLIRKSLSTLQELVSRYPRTKAGRNAAILLALDRIESRRLDEAITLLRRAVALNPGKEEALLFYLSLGLRAAGREGAAREVEERLKSIDRRSFYLDPSLSHNVALPLLDSKGRMVLFGKGSLMELLDRVTAQKHSSYQLVESCLEHRQQKWPRSVQLPHFGRASWFLRFGFDDWAKWEIDELLRRSSHSPEYLYTLGLLCDRYGLFWRSMRAFVRIELLASGCKRSQRETFWDIFEYPIAYPGLVMEHCARYRFPPALAFAMMREESRFDAAAVSRAGAVGLMQIMPETGRAIASEIGFPLSDSDDLFDPEVNISFGMHYATKLLKRCAGDYHMMLAAYNAGPTNATRWFSRGAASIQEEVDRIGYDETKRYVKLIVESAHAYAELLGAGSLWR